jgi:hypothetical protein
MRLAERETRRRRDAQERAALRGGKVWVDDLVRSEKKPKTSSASAARPTNKVSSSKVERARARRFYEY